MMPNKKQNSASPRFYLTAFLSALLAFVLSLASPLNAQLAGKGGIKGVVTDPSGAVVPNATVVATSTSRGTKTSTTSTSSGDFTISTLDPDTYTLTVTAAAPDDHSGKCIRQCA